MRKRVHSVALENLMPWLACSNASFGRLIASVISTISII
jgi:hypothetical protein